MLLAHIVEACVFAIRRDKRRFPGQRLVFVMLSYVGNQGLSVSVLLWGRNKGKYSKCLLWACSRDCFARANISPKERNSFPPELQQSEKVNEAVSEKRKMGSLGGVGRCQCAYKRQPARPVPCSRPRSQRRANDDNTHVEQIQALSLKAVASPRFPLELAPLERVEEVSRCTRPEREAVVR